MDRRVLSLLAHPNYRGRTTTSLVFQLQDLRGAWFELEPCPSDYSPQEWEDGHKYFLKEAIKGIEQEIERRRRLVYTGVPNTEIIQAIKDSINIDEVLSWYTDVFTYKNQWTYRCTLHGEDKHPSGIIYRAENRFHCFVCNKGGDVFDAVQYFERVTLPEAISKLARHTGIDTKPLVRKKYKDVSA